MRTRVIALETELARASMTAVELRDVEKNYNKMSGGRARAARARLSVARVLRRRSAPGARWSLNVAPAARSSSASPSSPRAAPPRMARLRALVGPARGLDKLDQRSRRPHSSSTSSMLTGMQSRAREPSASTASSAAATASSRWPRRWGRSTSSEAFPPEAKARAAALVGNVKAALRDRLEDGRLDGRGDARERARRSSTRWA